MFAWLNKPITVVPLEPTLPAIVKWVPLRRTYENRWLLIEQTVVRESSDVWECSGRMRSSTKMYRVVKRDHLRRVCQHSLYVNCVFVTTYSVRELIVSSYQAFVTFPSLCYLLAFCCFINFSRLIKLLSSYQSFVTFLPFATYSLFYVIYAHRFSLSSLIERNVNPLFHSKAHHKSLTL